MDTGGQPVLDIFATESTEEHGNISIKIFILQAFIFSCSSVDSVAIK
jgi:hypothetical protein